MTETRESTMSLNGLAVMRSAVEVGDDGEAEGVLHPTA